MPNNKEAAFEEDLIKILTEKSWEKEILKNCTEEDLIKNWAKIIFDNNRSIDKLNDYPLTDTEMQQILNQIQKLKTPLKLNGFINGKTVSIVRDNPDDTLHFGKTVNLKIYDRREISAGQSRYQIAQQPRFPAKNKMYNDRRGDLMLLINGMPMYHIELKREGVSVKEACNQIEKYAHEGVFTGLFSLVQIFVAMTPSETVYFANPGPDGVFNDAYYFHWANVYNEPINDYREVASSLLSLPMAHQLIGYYTIADNSDGVLKVMRSYQYFAASVISDKVSKIDWNDNNQLGGYIWHTTGSGKTMTSFKSAQLIASSKKADKVVFLMDRIELGTQSLKEYRGFAEETEEVQATEDTRVLFAKLKSNNPQDTLIVTSIQKMSNIKNDNIMYSDDIEKIRNKRIVFIIDEAHRSTFGEMLATIKVTFPKAVFFGFTGTPIQKENERKKNTTSTIFGDELHRYSIADGIRDKNVLGFDVNQVATFKDKDVRRVVALEKAKAKTEEEALNDPQKSKIYYKYMNEIKMAGYYDEKTGKYIKGIEDEIPNVQYTTDEHRYAIVEDIRDNWMRLSRNNKFHAIFATSSIPEAIEYYRLFKKEIPFLKITALFDSTIDNKGNGIFKEDGLEEIIKDYRENYGRNYSIPEFSSMKKDIAARLAHKHPYERIADDKKEQIDLLIVVDQMLTGFDSKWINTLYMDKLMKYENIIQAFSRTNRLFGRDKPFGTIRYYRKPHTMKRDIEDAIKLYSGDKPFGLFVQHLLENISAMNKAFEEITAVFNNAGIKNFEKLPEENEAQRKFAKEFSKLNGFLDAATIQGFKWDILTYTDNKTGEVVECNLDEQTYFILVLRYKELDRRGGGGGPGGVPYDLEKHLVEINTDRIDNDYMNSRFEKFVKLTNISDAAEDELRQAKEELHRMFPSLSEEEQHYAELLIHDIERKDVVIKEDYTFKDYIYDYIYRAKDERIHKVTEIFGLDEALLKEYISLNLNKDNINEYGRLNKLQETIDDDKAIEYYKKINGDLNKPLPMIRIWARNCVKNFILSGGKDFGELLDEDKSKD